MSKLFILKPNESMRDTLRTLTVQCPDDGKSKNYHCMEKVHYNDILFLCQDNLVAQIALARSDAYRTDLNYCVPEELESEYYRTVDIGVLKELAIPVDSLDHLFYSRSSKHHKPSRDDEPIRVYNSFKTQSYITELKYFYYDELKRTFGIADLF